MPRPGWRSWHSPCERSGWEHIPALNHQVPSLSSRFGAEVALAPDENSRAEVAERGKGGPGPSGETGSGPHPRSFPWSGGDGPPASTQQPLVPWESCRAELRAPVKEAGMQSQAARTPEFITSALERQYWFRVLVHHWALV